MRNKILALVSLAMCSFSVDAEAYTIKKNDCYRLDALDGWCLVDCDVGTVAMGGGCYTPNYKVGFSAN